jgi:mannosyltransferase
VPTRSSPGQRRALGAIGLLASVAGGIVVRFLTTSPLWLDEAQSVGIARMPLGDIAHALRRDGHPPLYYWLLHGWMDLFGTSDVAVRSLSGVFSVAALPLAWKLGDRVGGRRVARWSLALAALSPFAVRYATETRMYSLVMLLVLAVALALDALLRRPRLVTAALVAVVSSALLWTHYWSLYLFAVVGGLLVLRWWRDRSSRTATTWAIASLLAGAVLWLPWVPTLLAQSAHTGTPWGLASRPTVVAQTTLADFGGGGYAEALLLGTVLAVLAVAAFAHSDRLAEPSGPWRPLDVRVLAVVSVGTLVVGSGASYVTHGAYAPRYASVIAPLFLVVAAVGITRLRPTWVQAGVMATAGVLVIAALGKNVVDQRTRADDIATTILTRATPRDLVVVCPDQLGPSLSRILDQRHSHLTVVPYPNGGDAHLVDWRDYAARNRHADPAAFTRSVVAQADGAPIWVVWASGYRTLVGQCEAVIVHLNQARGEQPSAPFTGAFEPANLTRYP